jgi:sterol desaturase/sphingolipid hydroxylase (fatty acid hydroxylase superfamily)
VDEHPLNYEALAIPIFGAAILIEAWIHRKRRSGNYAFGTAMSDIGCGIVFLALELLFNLVALAAYAWLFTHWSVVDWPDGHWAPWAIAFVGVDLMFYWWHRASHVVNFLWAIHGVHHQSEDMNLAVALRQPAFEPITWFFFYAPLALLGVSPIHYLGAYAFNRFYQFWIHTELVDKGPRAVEWVLNTPSHHRAHHGVNEQYLDTNYAGVMILWDRLFRSFEPEQERVVYGTTVPLRSYNPVWSNLALFDRIRELQRGARSVGDWLWAPFAHPEWLPDGMSPDPTLPKRIDSPKYRPKPSRTTVRYVVAHMIVLSGLLVPFVLFAARLPVWQVALGSASVVLGAMAFLGFVERVRWAWTVEVVRLGLLAAAITAISTASVGLLPATAAGAVAAFGFGIGLWRYAGDDVDTLPERDDTEHPDDAPDEDLDPSDPADSGGA